MPVDRIGELLDDALASGDDGPLRAALVSEAGIRRSLDEVAAAFAGAVGEVIRRPDPPVARLEDLLDGWAALSDREAAADGPEVVLPCAAIAAYGEAAVVRPDWFGDEVAKLRRAAADARERVRDGVIQALRRMLASDRPRTSAELLAWADDDDPGVGRVASDALAGRSPPGEHRLP